MKVGSARSFLEAKDRVGAESSEEVAEDRADDDVQIVVSASAGPAVFAKPSLKAAISCVSISMVRNISVMVFPCSAAMCRSCYFFLCLVKIRLGNLDGEVHDVCVVVEAKG